MRRIAGLIVVVAIACGGVAASGAEVEQPTQSLADKHGCKLWDQSFPPKASITWTGGCKDGFLEGKGTLRIFSDGKPTDRYDGTMRAGRYDGEGVYVWANGDRYKGGFKDGLFQGQAIYTKPKGTHYQGGYNHDLRSGHGVMTWPNGARYDGEWLENLANGRGTYRAPDGKSYSGTWTNGCYRDANQTISVGTTVDKCK